MKSRNHYTAEQKVGIVRRHLLEKIPVSDICDQYKLKPTVYYRWQKQLFENGAAAFEHSRNTAQHIPFLNTAAQAAKSGLISRRRYARL